MKRLSILGCKLFMVVMIVFSLSGCASSKIALDNGKNATFNVYNQKDDRDEKLGKNPVYVLMEKQDDRQFKVIAISKKRMPIVNNDQERLVISRNFTNVAPDYEKFNMRYKERPASGNRYDYYFSCNGDSIKNKAENYSPCRSFLSYYMGKGQSLASITGTLGTSSRPAFNTSYSLNTGLITEIVTGNKLIEQAKTLVSGTDDTISLNATKSDIMPLAVSEIWLVKQTKKADSQRYLFKPTKFISSGDVVAEDKKLVIRTSGLGLANEIFTGLGHTKKLIPYNNLNTFKVYDRKEQRDNKTSCFKFFAKYNSGEAKNGIICGEDNQTYPFIATNGERDWTIGNIRGLSKKVYSDDEWQETTIRFEAYMIGEIQFLTKDEAKKYEGKKSE
jgi:hypothetical protein